MKISKGVGSLLIFALLFGLVYFSYDGLTEPEGYNITIESNANSMLSSFDDLTIVKGINQTLTGVYTIGNPTATTFDIIGALASSAIGIIKGVGGLLIFPFQIINIFGTYYSVPPVVIIIFNIFISSIVGFLILSTYLGREI